MTYELEAFPPNTVMTVGVNQAVCLTRTLGDFPDHVPAGSLGIVLGVSKNFNSSVRVAVRWEDKERVIDIHDQDLVILDEENWQVLGIREDWGMPA